MTPSDPVRTAAMALLEACYSADSLVPFMAALESALALPVEQPRGWTGVDEQLPLTTGLYLVFTKPWYEQARMRVAKFKRELDYAGDPQWSCAPDVTHWVPLPASPSLPEPKGMKP